MPTIHTELRWVTVQEKIQIPYTFGEKFKKFFGMPVRDEIQVLNKHVLIHVPVLPTHHNLPSPQQHQHHQTEPARLPTRVQNTPVKTLAEEIQLGLKLHAPTQTKSGVNGSFFLCDSKGHKCAIFKPMSMEAGGAKNHRLTASQNVQFRKSILPGQGAGNEVLAYGLDRYAFSGRYELPYTILLRLSHPVFEGTELGSAQVFLPGCRPLCDITSQEIDQIPQPEWEKLNFRLISGSTDAHYGNILYNKTEKKLYLIDSGDDFVGEEGEEQYWNPWAGRQRCNQAMSQGEINFLSNLNIAKIMDTFEKQALENGKLDPILEVKADKLLTQELRLYLAKAVGKNNLTQRQWALLMTPLNDTPSALETIYVQEILPLSYNGRFGTDWRFFSRQVNWQKIENRIQEEINKIKRIS